MDNKMDLQMLKAMADKNRLTILRLLQNGETCACNLLKALHISQPTLSHHMKLLCDAGIVNARKEGKWMCYEISDTGRVKVHEIVEDYLTYNAEKCACSDK